MKFKTTAEMMQGALATLRPFVHRPGQESVAASMSCTRVRADADAGTVTFIGNNASQRIEFALKMDVEESGEALFSVAEAITVLGTIPKRSDAVTIELGETGLEVHSRTVSVSAVPVIDLERVTIAPSAPARHEGDLMSLTVKAEELSSLITYATPAAIGSTFPSLVMWVQDAQLCLMGMAKNQCAFASAKGAQAEGELDIMLWSPANLSRVAALGAGEDKVSIRLDADDNGEPRSYLSVVVETADVKYVVEQTSERMQEAYAVARGKMLQHLGKILDETRTTVGFDRGELSAAMDSAEKVRALRAGRNAEGVTRLAIEDAVAMVSLPDDGFSQEIKVASSRGELPVKFDVDAAVARGLLGALPSSARTQFNLPEHSPGAKKWAALTVDEVSDLRTTTLPVSGYCALLLTSHLKD